MASKQIPKSRAKTAYGLLSEVAALALAEPRRMRMSMFLDMDARDRVGAEQAPACNTVGCICGWAVVLKGTKAQIAEQSRVGVGMNGYGVMPGAKLLGLDGIQAFQLFNPDRGISTLSGTLNHARQVGKRIREFQKANRAQLLAKKV